MEVKQNIICTVNHYFSYLFLYILILWQTKIATLPFFQNKKSILLPNKDIPSLPCSYMRPCMGVLVKMTPIEVAVGLPRNRFTVEPTWHALSLDFG